MILGGSWHFKPDLSLTVTYLPPPPLYSLTPPTPHPLTGQYEELKKAKDSLEEEVHRLKAYKKECGHLKAEYNAIKLKVSGPCVEGGGGGGGGGDVGGGGGGGGGGSGE